MVMNLLVIGNGFDLAHGLKTNYLDFLQWAYENEHMGRNYGKGVGHIRCGNGVTMPYPGFDLQWYWDNRLSQSYKHDPAFAWVLFKEHDSWIDLENNLAVCLESTEIKRKLNERGFGAMQALFTEFLLPKFEQYIAEVINNDSATERKLLVSGADLVLSFNYSNTFERLYGERKQKVCYINGKAQAQAIHSNIVFGCDCYEYSSQGKDQMGFDKVVQRTQKNTCDAYKDWISEDNKNHYQIHIVGHSIGKTDWDILRPLVTAKGNTTQVYYHDEEAYNDLVFNMIGMVGREIMIQRKIDFHHISELNIERHSGIVVI